MSGVLTVIELTVPISRRFTNFLSLSFAKDYLQCNFSSIGNVVFVFTSVFFSKCWIPAPEKNLDE